MIGTLRVNLVCQTACSAPDKGLGALGIYLPFFVELGTGIFFLGNYLCVNWVFQNFLLGIHEFQFHNNLLLPISIPVFIFLTCSILTHVCHWVMQCCQLNILNNYCLHVYSVYNNDSSMQHGNFC